MFGNNAHKRFLGKLGMTAVAALLTLSVGCVRIETGGLSDMPLTFRTYTPHTTKAAAEPGVISGNALPSNTSFGVFAFYQPGVVGSRTGVWGNGGSRSSWKPDYMFNEQVDFDGSNYTYAPLRYWPANEENTISFWAYWPIELFNATNHNGSLKFYESDGTTRYTANSTGLPVAKYSVSSDPAQQYDLLFDAFDNYDRFYDKYADGTSCSPGMVPLRFRHVLSQIEFRITADGESLPDNATIDITSFELTNIYTDGTCASPAASIESAGDAANFWAVTYSNPVTVELSTSAMSTSLILMPQNLAEDTSDTATRHSKVKLNMTYDIVFPAAHDPEHAVITYANNRVEDAYLWRKKRDGHPEDVAYGTDRWLPGRKYVYNIEVGLEKIVFSEVTEISWNTSWTYTEPEQP